jgi:aminoglycoside phosphotransferase (APT) family kinase protein
MELSSELIEAVTRLVGIPVEPVQRTARGESGSTYLFHTRDGNLVVKLSPAAMGLLENQRRLVRLVNGLRDRGYPAPQYLGADQVDGVVFTVQRQLPGELLEPAPGAAPESEVFSGLLPQLLDAIELQADAGDLRQPPWPEWLIETVTRGGDGYCLHTTMRAHQDTAVLLARLQHIAARARGKPRDNDVMHFDMNPANILHRHGVLTGVVDWNVTFTGASQGDRGFDIATLLFYSWDLPSTREPLWSKAIQVSGPSWTAVYLCHLALRQVEWTRRHRPGTAEDARFCTIATQVLARCGD